MREYKITLLDGNRIFYFWRTVIFRKSDQGICSRAQFTHQFFMCVKAAEHPACTVNIENHILWSYILWRDKIHTYFSPTSGSDFCSGNIGRVHMDRGILRLFQHLPSLFGRKLKKSTVERRFDRRLSLQRGSRGTHRFIYRLLCYGFIFILCAINDFARFF